MASESLQAHEIFMSRIFSSPLLESPQEVTSSDDLGCTQAVRAPIIFCTVEEERRVLCDRSRQIQRLSNLKVFTGPILSIPPPESVPMNELPGCNNSPLPEGGGAKRCRKYPKYHAIEKMCTVRLESIRSSLKVCRILC